MRGSAPGGCRLRIPHLAAAATVQHPHSDEAKEGKAPKRITCARSPLTRCAPDQRNSAHKSGWRGKARDAGAGRVKPVLRLQNSADWGGLVQLPGSEAPHDRRSTHPRILRPDCPDIGRASRRDDHPRPGVPASDRVLYDRSIARPTQLAVSARPYRQVSPGPRGLRKAASASAKFSQSICQPLPGKAIPRVPDPDPAARADRLPVAAVLQPAARDLPRLLDTAHVKA